MTKTGLSDRIVSQRFISFNNFLRVFGILVLQIIIILMSYVTISSIFRKDVDTRFGIKPKVGIKTQEHGDKWLSTFKTKGTEDWTEGMKVEVNISESGDFLNFNPVLGAGSMGAPATKASPELEGRVKKLEDAVFGGQMAQMQSEALAEATPAVETTLEDEFDTGF